MSLTADGPSQSTPLTGQPKPEGKSIVSPTLDLLLLGGASLILIPMSFTVPEQSIPGLAIFAALLSNVINHPHFAASYQIFYRDYRNKAFGDTVPELRQRYLFAGVIVPIALIVFLATCFLTENARALGLGGNLMAFLVGWHYNKQGYGMLMVDSVNKRRFFNDREKNLLLGNAYTTWMAVYLWANYIFSEQKLWTLDYFVISVPLPLLYLSSAIALMTTLMTLAMFARKHLAENGSLPGIGVFTYLVTLYFWPVLVYNPVAVLFVPAFHSLQYLYVVWRFETNRTELLAAEGTTASNGWPLARFSILAIILGFMGFWFLPSFLDAQIAYSTAEFGSNAFMFMFWIFLNIHHYVIDSVIWRRENPETARFLFGAKPKKAT